MENAKIKKFKCDILSNFQTMWKSSNFAILIFEIVLLAKLRIDIEKETYSRHFWNGLEGWLNAR